MARAFSLVLIGCLAAVLWQTDTNTACGQAVIDWTGGGINDSYNSTANWLGLNVPNTTSESARFALGGSYNVTFSAGATTNVSDLIVLAGDINFASLGAVLATYNVADDVTINGGDFALSDTGGSGDVQLNVGDELQVYGGSTFRVDNGSRVRINDLRLADIPGGNGTILIDDAGSQLVQTGLATINIGQDGNGTLIVQSGATATFSAPLQLASFAGAGNEGNLYVLGGEVSLSSLSVAPGGTDPTATGRVSVNATGGLLDVTGSLVIGNNDAGGPTALVDLSSSGVLNANGTTAINNSGELQILSQAEFNAAGQVTMSDDSVIYIDNGVLNLAAGLDNSANGHIDLRDGEINVLGGSFVPSSGSFTIDGADFSDSPLVKISGGGTATIAGDLRLGNALRGELRVESGGILNASNVSLAGAFSTSTGIATVTGAGSEIDTGAMTIGPGGVGSLIVEQGGKVSSETGNVYPTSEATISDDTSLWAVDNTLLVEGELLVESGGQVTSNAGSIRTFGIATISGSGSNWTTTSSLNVGLGNVGTMIVEAGGSVSSVGGILGNVAGGNGTVTVTGTDGLGNPSTWTITEILSIGPVGVGSLTVADGGYVENDAGSIGSGSIAVVTGADSLWTNNGNLTIGTASGTGTLAVEAGGQVSVLETLRIRSGGVLTIDGGSVVVNTFRNNEGGQFNFLAGTLTIESGVEVGTGIAFPTGLSLVPHQHLVSGLETTIAPLRTLKLEGGRLSTTDLVVNGALQFNSGTLELNGGTITGLASLAVPTGGEFRAGGIQALQILGAAGSTITATDDLTLGDATHSSGFYSNGVLNVGTNVVTLADANDAVLDSAAAVMLGDGANAGTLAAANGLTLDFGGNIAGHGTVDTPNDPSKPFINNGHVAGNSPGEPITLPGYVKGVGTLDNVVVTGTNAPGFSPATVHYGSVTYAGALEIELGGLAVGSSDRLIHSGTAELGGSLAVSLINGFVPTSGNTFEILTAAGGVSGTFSTELLPALGSGLEWDVIYGSNNVVLSVATAGLPGDFDLDGDVDGRDFLLWQRNPSVGDLADWQDNYGAGSLTASVAVPEPPMMGAMMVVSLAVRFLARRREQFACVW